MCVVRSGPTTQRAKHMTKSTERKLFNAAFDVILRIWGGQMNDLQAATLATEIVREIEARNVLLSNDVVAA